MSIPYGLIADCVRAKTLVPFLGAAASRVGADPGTALPDSVRLAQLLADKAHYPGSSSDPLTKIAQYVEEIAGDRDLLLGYINNTFNLELSAGYESATTRFFSRLSRKDIPRLIVTTNYDVTIERTLEEIGASYLVVAHIFGNSKFFGRLLCYETLTAAPAAQTVSEVNERLLVSQERGEERVIVYKIHGSSRPIDNASQMDSVILTENDYIRFMAQDILRYVPLQIQKLLTDARVLYLGYSLLDWNFRVLLKRIRDLQSTSGRKKEFKNSGDRRHWACVLNPDAVEQQFWAERGVTVYSADLQDFLIHLGNEMVKRV